MSAGEADICMSLGLIGGGVAAIVLAGLLAIYPSVKALALLAVLSWFVLPGLALVWRIYRNRDGWMPVLLAAPACGYVFSSLTLLALWAAGVRGVVWLAISPVAAAVLAWLAGSLASTVSAPRFTRRDVAAVLVSLLAVPVVVAIPYARVGADLPEGRAYRAYFTAD